MKCSGKSSSVVALPDFGYEDVEKISQKFEDRIPEALVKAQEWKSDAYLFTVNVFFQGANLSANHSPILYFRSPDASLNKEFFVELSQDFNSLAEWGEESFANGQTPIIQYQAIKPEDLKIGFAQALEIAEQNGGSDFRKNQESYSITLDLYNKTAVGFEWGVYYYELTDADTYESIEIYLDAATGAVKDIKTN
ncbi:MAG: PepSY domain-containing protein [Patescibacteria group bacterium]|nr:PepSY domain-containing protein [Patescibacteria group bacterium]